MPDPVVTTTQTPEQNNTSLAAGGTGAAVVTAPTEFVPDATKSAEENALAKTAFDTKAAADKVAAEATAKTAAEKEAAAKANDTKAAPFKLEEIKVPDGMVIDEAVSKPFVDIVNKFGLGRDAVAELVKLQANVMKTASEESTRIWDKTNADWTAATKADPEIGGEKLPEVLSKVSMLIDHYKIPELRTALDMTGAGNNPHIVKFLAKIAADMSEGGFVKPNTPTAGTKTTEELLYPTHFKT